MSRNRLQSNGFWTVYNGLVFALSKAGVKLCQVALSFATSPFGSPKDHFWRTISLWGPEGHLNSSSRRGCPYHPPPESTSGIFTYRLTSTTLREKTSRQNWELKKNQKNSPLSFSEASRSGLRHNALNQLNTEVSRCLSFVSNFNSAISIRVPKILR